MKTTTYSFTSARLGFREWRDEDIPLFAAMNADPVVMEFFPNTRSYDETTALVNQFRAHHALHGYCFFAADRLDTGTFIGFIGLNNPAFKAWFMPCVEIGWRLLRSEWAQGFATEGAIRCLQYAFDELQLKEVWSFTAIPNKRSERIMQKAGMHDKGRGVCTSCLIGWPSVAATCFIPDTGRQI